MYYMVQFYQEIADNEIESTRRRQNVNAPTITARDAYLRERTDRNNPMQSSIIKLLTELESNNTDTVPLIK